ncbi:hypothetical protein PVAP13_7KG048200 [Panicum virgatum]|uniref:Uncharacterized protein n=1 Tax=Panicum virgatum TaxID=38727 RepID=A0A8T0QAQ0_PANVG|nr:hypothetical protein PVAP13_7KG048200 [Panicum virgatum]
MIMLPAQAKKPEGLLPPNHRPAPNPLPHAGKITPPSATILPHLPPYDRFDGLPVPTPRIGDLRSLCRPSTSPSGLRPTGGASTWPAASPCFMHPLPAVTPTGRRPLVVRCCQPPLLAAAVSIAGEATFCGYSR